MTEMQGIYEYLNTERFLKGVIESRALATAFETGIMDYLIETRHTDLDELLSVFKLDPQGLGLMIDLLCANRVIDEDDGEILLSKDFIKVLPYMDLMREKLDFANLVAGDVTDLFTALIKSPGEFFSRSRIFRLFSYDRCLDPTPENREIAKRWMRYTTALTRHEAGVCMAHYAFDRHARIMDIGGNSGEFALRICRGFPSISATVLDLPLVCDIGEAHVSGEPEAERIRFIRGDALAGPMPTGFDLITFKSMLHDWPDREAERLIERAVECLAPGGTLLVFERAPLKFEDSGMPYSMLPILLFFRSFRQPEKYEAIFRDKGLTDIKIDRMQLDTPFFIITGAKTK